MKLTRFTNHRPASNSRPRSSQSGQAGTIRKLSGAARITAATASPCSNSRGTTGMEWTSSAKPTAAMNSVAPNTATGIFISAVPANAMTADGRDQRGRDHRDARALRRRNPMRRARIRLCQRDPQQQRPDRPCQDARQQRRRHGGGQRQQELRTGHSIRVESCSEDYLGTSIGAVPCAAFSALKIQTSPPTAPTMKDTAP